MRPRNGWARGRQRRWPAVSLRGRAFLAGGAALMLGAFVAGQITLARAAALAIAIPLVAWTAVGLRSPRLEVTRDVGRGVLPAGSEAEIGLTITAYGSGAGSANTASPGVIASRCCRAIRMPSRRCVSRWRGSAR